jgi:hypothetical protein
LVAQPPLERVGWHLDRESEDPFEIDGRAENALRQVVETQIWMALLMIGNLIFLGVLSIT